MKIYPSHHNVCEAARPKFLDIPLAHIEKHYIPKKVVAEVPPEIAHAESSFIAPYRRFQDDDFLIFTDDGKISDAKLQRKDGVYVYMPGSVKEFTPQEFEFSLLVKRNTEIKSDRNYDFRIGVYDTDGAKDLANKLVSIGGDAPYRGVAPSNIFINSGSTKTADMMTKDGEGFDFVFVQGSSTEFLENDKGKIPYEELAGSHANLWVTLTDEGCQKCFDMMDDRESITAWGVKKTDAGFDIAEEEDGKAALCVFSSNAYGYKAKTRAALKGIEDTLSEQLMPLVNQKKKSPIIIVEHADGRYTVVSHKNMFEHLDVYAPFVYSVLEELYVRSYQKTSKRTSWIADDSVDYMCSLDTPFRKRHPDLDADEIIHSDLRDMEGYELRSVTIDNSKVFFNGLSANGLLQFKKLSQTDPKKESGETSIFTYKHTVAYCSGDKDKLVESGVHIGTSIQDDTTCLVTVQPFASSKYSLLSTETLTFELPDPSEKYILRALPVNKEGKSVVSLVPEDANGDGGGAIVLARVYTEFEGEPAAYDIRQLGGGLPEECTDYDMIDIGNPKGRPYRVGTGAVITLPKAYEKYDERIRKAVESYKVAADQFYITYRDE